MTFTSSSKHSISRSTSSTNSSNTERSERLGVAKERLEAVQEKKHQPVTFNDDDVYKSERLSLRCLRRASRW